MDYVVDDESRICPIKVPGILVDARDAWGCETFDESLERAGRLFIDVSTINRPSVNWHSELIEVHRLDIEQGLSMVTGLNCQRANSITLGWEGKCFYPIRPDFGRLLIQSAFEVPTLNLCELHLLHKFHEQSNRNYSKVMTLHRALQVGELALESTHSFNWWLKFWDKRGFAILKNGEPFAHLNAAPAQTRPAQSTEADFVAWARAEKEKHGLWPPTDGDKTGRRQGWKEWATANSVNRNIVKGWVAVHGFRNQPGAPKKPANNPANNPAKQ